MKKSKGAIISKYLWLKSVFVNAKILILSYKISIFAFTKILRDDYDLILQYILAYFPDYYGYGPSSYKLQTTFSFVFTCHVIGYHFESIVVDYYANESKV